MFDVWLSAQSIDLCALVINEKSIKVIESVILHSSVRNEALFTKVLDSINDHVISVISLAYKLSKTGKNLDLVRQIIERITYEHGQQDLIFLVMQTLIEVDGLDKWKNKVYALFFDNTFFISQLDPSADISMISQYLCKNENLKLLLGASQINTLDFERITSQRDLNMLL